MPSRDIALALLVALLWGVNFVVMKHAVSEVPPLALAGIRFTLAAIPAIFFLTRPAIPWRVLLGFSFFFGVVKFGLLFTAFRLGMPSGLAALVLQMQAVFTVALAYVWLAERPSAVQWTGIAVALGGVALIMAATEGATSAWPIALTLAAAVAWSIANMAVKAAGRIDMLAFAAWSSLLPGPLMLVASAVVEGPGTAATAVANLTPYGVAAIAYLVGPVSLLSGSIWGSLLSRHPMVAVAPFALLVPVIGLLCGWIVYGETLAGLAAIGATFIAGGLALNVLAGRAARLA